MECIYCHKIFSGKPTLVKHQRSTKKCLEIQQTLGVEIKKLSYSCKICNKEITSNNGLSYHENKCKKKSVDLQQTVLTVSNYLPLITRLNSLLISETKSFFNNLISLFDSFTSSYINSALSLNCGNV